MGQENSVPNPLLYATVERSASSWCTVGVASSQGVRHKMEDRHLVQFSGSCFGNQVVRHAAFAVLDGHGGARCVELASEALGDALMECAVEELEEAEELLRKAFLRTDETIRDQLAGGGSGATVASAVVTCFPSGKLEVRLAHAGDTRTVMRCSRGNLETVDHKPCHPEEQERIVRAGGAVRRRSVSGPLRVDGVLSVSRGLGDFVFKPRGQDPETCKISPLPEVLTVRCDVGDWMLIACDGVFDVVTSDFVVDFVNERLPREGSADCGAIAGQLVETCLAKGSRDNCTALMVHFVPTREACDDSDPDILGSISDIGGCVDTGLCHFPAEPLIMVV